MRNKHIICRHHLWHGQNRCLHRQNSFNINEIVKRNMARLARLAVNNNQVIATKYDVNGRSHHHALRRREISQELTSVMQREVGPVPCRQKKQHQTWDGKNDGHQSISGQYIAPPERHILFKVFGLHKRNRLMLKLLRYSKTKYRI